MMGLGQRKQQEEVGFSSPRPFSRPLAKDKWTGRDKLPSRRDISCLTPGPRSSPEGLSKGMVSVTSVIESQSVRG